MTPTEADTLAKRMINCAVPECDRAVRTRGWCDKHYKRWLRHGDPLKLHGWTPDEDAADRLKARLAWNLETTCLEWTGPTEGFGYGRLVANGKHLQAHRLAWELRNGPIPEGMQVCHACDNPKCCNVHHLFLGTHLDNMRDRQQKGRTASGERAGRYVHGRLVGVAQRYYQRKTDQ